MSWIVVLSYDLKQRNEGSPSIDANHRTSFKKYLEKHGGTEGITDTIFTFSINEATINVSLVKKKILLLIKEAIDFANKAFPKTAAIKNIDAEVFFSNINSWKFNQETINS